VFKGKTENLTNETAGLHLINSYQVTATYKEFLLKFGGSVRNGVMKIFITPERISGSEKKIKTSGK